MFSSKNFFVKCEIGRKSADIEIEGEKEVKHLSVHTAIRRSEVFFADLHGGVGYEQNGERPVVVLQNDMGNRYSPTVIVAPLTSSRTKKPLPTHVWCGADSGLLKNSCILLEQIRAIDKTRLSRYLCSLNVEMMGRVDQAAAISLGLAQ